MVSASVVAAETTEEAQFLAGLDALVERTCADELMFAGAVYDPETRKNTLAQIAKVWF
jgi:hypothetical protein